MATQASQSRWTHIDLEKDLDFSRPEHWYKPEYVHKYPWNREILPADILFGYEPPERFIRRDTKVLAMGSCFADNFIRFLSQQGYNQWSLPGERHDSAGEESLITFWGMFENLFVILQQFRWAFDGFRPKSPLWYTKDKRYFEATEDRRTRVQYALENAEVFVITLGLSEVWFDTVENEPMWRTVPIGMYEKGRQINRRVTVEETVQAFRELDRIADEHLPNRKFIFTLSPVPLTASFRKQSVVSSNVISKAILRVALDQFLQDEAIQAKGRYFYYPSYELVLELFESPFLPDNIHVRPGVVETMLEIFKHLYTDMPSRGLEIPPAESYATDLERQLRLADSDLVEKEIVIHDLLRTAQRRLELMEGLERQVQHSDRELRAKELVIEELHHAAKERLEIIETTAANTRREDLEHRLQTANRELVAKEQVIESLHRAAQERLELLRRSAMDSRARDLEEQLETARRELVTKEQAIEELHRTAQARPEVPPPSNAWSRLIKGFARDILWKRLG